MVKVSAFTVGVPIRPNLARVLVLGNGREAANDRDELTVWALGLSLEWLKNIKLLLVPLTHAIFFNGISVKSSWTQCLL